MITEIIEEVAKTALEVVGLLAVAAGATLGLLPVIGWASLAVGGALLVAGVVGAGQVSRRAGRR